ncbi:MAG: alpha-L-fucosidase C-terminal domain-containing protein [Ignavibacteriaceae bacterium]
MKVNSEAIYYSRPIKPYKDGKVCLTQLKNGNVYAIYLADKDENTIPAKIELTKYCPAENSDIQLLGTGTKIKWQKKGDGCEFEIPESVRSNPPCKYAWTFKISH